MLTILGYALGGLAVASLVVVISVYALSERRLTREYAVTPRTPPVATDARAVERGRHVVEAIAKCTACHGDKLEGRVVFDNPAMGRVVAPNLTRGIGGIGRSRTDLDLVRAIRHGIAPAGRPLLLMPSVEYAELSEPDLAAVIAYLKSIAPADNPALPPRSGLGPIARALLLGDRLPILSAELIDHDRAAPPAVPDAPSIAYGGYLARVGCVGCHGTTLAGGPVAAGDPSWPPASNLTSGGPTKSWSEAQFAMLLRTGIRPDSTPVNPAMPWRETGRMTDAEIRALWLYTRSIPAHTTGEARTVQR
jgi:mono/diheme cytochrome c family protein